MPGPGIACYTYLFETSAKLHIWTVKYLFLSTWPIILILANYCIYILNVDLQYRGWYISYQIIQCKILCKFSCAADVIRFRFQSVLDTGSAVIFTWMWRSTILSPSRLSFWAQARLILLQSVLVKAICSRRVITYSSCCSCVWSLECYFWAQVWMLW